MSGLNVSQFEPEIAKCDRMSIFFKGYLLILMQDVVVLFILNKVTFILDSGMNICMSVCFMCT